MPSFVTDQPAHQSIIDLVNQLDIPAKGRIAHHIRTGRIARALHLCAAAQLFLWQKVWKGGGSLLLEQVRALSRLENLLRSPGRV